MWISAKEAGVAILNTYKALEKAVAHYNKVLTDNDHALDEIKNNIRAFKKKNPGLMDEIFEEL